jgi:hypothetical protein
MLPPPSPEPPPLRWADPPLEAWALSHGHAEAERLHRAVRADLADGVEPQEALGAVFHQLRRLTGDQRRVVRARLNRFL